jgi:hypothetical protein
MSNPDQPPTGSEPEIYEPSAEDRDPEAEAQMRMGRVDLDGENALHDPWFRDPEHALNWRSDGEAE